MRHRSGAFDGWCDLNLSGGPVVEAFRLRGINPRERASWPLLLRLSFSVQLRVLAKLRPKLHETLAKVSKQGFSNIWPVVSSQIKEACLNDLRRSQRCHDRRNTGRHKDPDPMVSEHIDLRLKSLLALARSVMVRGLNLLLLRHCSRPPPKQRHDPPPRDTERVLTIRSATAAVE